MDLLGSWGVILLRINNAVHSPLRALKHEPLLTV